jgi:hypothetical protein
VPIELDVLVACCLCKDPTLRPGDTEALRVALEGVGTGAARSIAPEETLPVPAAGVRARYAIAAPQRPAPRLRPERASVSRRPWLVPSVLGGAVGIAVLAALLVPSGDASEDIVEITAGPSDEPVAAPAATPSVATPALGVPVVQPAAAAPVAPATTPARTPEPLDADTRPRVRASKPKRPRAVAVDDERPEPTPAPQPVPETPEPQAKPAVPKRKGDTLDWPSPAPSNTPKSAD